MPCFSICSTSLAAFGEDFAYQSMLHRLQDFSMGLRPKNPPTLINEEGDEVIKRLIFVFEDVDVDVLRTL